MKEYKVLSMWEPWASLLVHGIKKIETRPKPTTWTIEKGSYLIHAAKRFTREQDRLCTYNEHFRDALNEVTNCIKIGVPYWEHHFNFGYIIGAVDVVKCVPIIEIGGKPFLDDDQPYSNSKMFMVSLKSINEPELSFGDYREGRYAWILRNAKVLETPIPYKGQQGYYAPFKGDINQLKFK
jgi:hypothetical protein